MLIYISELCMATFLGSTVKNPSVNTGADAEAGAGTGTDADDLRVVGLILLSAMVLQESWLAILEIRNSPTLPPKTPSAPNNPPLSNPQPQSQIPTTNPSQFPKTSSSPSPSPSVVSTRFRAGSVAVSERVTRSRSRLASNTGSASAGLGGLSLG